MSYLLLHTNGGLYCVKLFCVGMFVMVQKDLSFWNVVPWYQTLLSTTSIARLQTHVMCNMNVNLLVDCLERVICLKRHRIQMQLI